ncbi:MAG TPA: FAD-dependent oxidoreductase [Ktedonobacterales bacterium]|nr:FAD-dependent oxidoreductase [Ktedonobacterales bacterium]
MALIHGATAQPIASPASPEQAAARYRQLTQARYDLVIIGGGSAGLSAAQLARTLGASVALVDREKLGGECLYTGCVPSKALLHAALVAATIRSAAAVGLRASLEPTDLDPVMTYVQHAIGRVYEVSDAPEHLLSRGIDVAFGETRFVSPQALSMNGETITARRFLIATGSHPAIPPIPGLREAGFLTNETIFSLRALPERLAVIGGGPVGCEFGQAFARLGSQVTLLQRPERLLPKDEPEASATLQARLETEGMTVALRAVVTEVTRSERGIILTVQVSGEMQQIAVDAILVATGRAPNVEGLDLEAAGVQYDARRNVGVDKYLRTSNPRVYAAGDVTGGYRFTHAAALDARTAVRNALFPGKRKRDTRVIPWATFTEPEVAHVGLTEAEARRQHGAAVRVDLQHFTGVDRAVTDDATSGFLKLVSASNGKLLGAQLVGPRAGDNINEIALALDQRLTLSQIAATTHVYPTLALAIQQAASAYSLERLGRNAIVTFMRRIAGMRR